MKGFCQKTFSGYRKKTALKGNQSYADSFKNSGLKRKETNAFRNIFNSNNDSASSFWLGFKLGFWLGFKLGFWLGFKLGFWPLQRNPVN